MYNKTKEVKITIWAELGRDLRMKLEVNWKQERFFFRWFHLDNSGAKGCKHNFVSLKFLWRPKGRNRKCKQRDLDYFEGFTWNCFCCSLRICSTRLSVQRRKNRAFQRVLSPWRCYALILSTFSFHLQYQLDMTSCLHGKTQLFSPSGFSVTFPQVFLSIRLSSRRVFLSLEFKLPWISKIPNCM